MRISGGPSSSVPLLVVLFVFPEVFLPVDTSTLQLESSFFDDSLYALISRFPLVTCSKNNVVIIRYSHQSSFPSLFLQRRKRPKNVRHVHNKKFRSCSTTKNRKDLKSRCKMMHHSNIFIICRTTYRYKVI